MQDEQEERSSPALSYLPWLVGAGVLIAYLLTLSHWVTLSSLPLVAKVTGWDWTLPQQAPLFFVLTYPARWLPAALQPVFLNVFAAVCAALATALLARSVTLLPHDRTHEQRQRERSEYSLLSIPGAWMPPVLAALTFALQSTFWENATSATNESLDVLLFAYVIRCLLEFRVDQRTSWLSKFAFVYALGMVNDWAFLGFLPLFVVALIWIRGTAIFEFESLANMILFGCLGLLLYMLIPAWWTASHATDASFGQILKTYLSAQKSFLFNFPALRSRALILSLTTVLPILIIGIRWPSRFGDTSAAGNFLTTLMFRLVHVLFLAACIAVAFDPKFSPRSLGFGLPFLTFYYLGALAIGYFSGYVLLVFGAKPSSKNWRKPSALESVFGTVAVAAVWCAVVAVPTALAMRNYPHVRALNGPRLAQFAELALSTIPQGGSLVLSDDTYALMLVEGYASRSSAFSNTAFIHTKSLPIPDYQRVLQRRLPGLWPDLLGGENPERIDDGSLLGVFQRLQKTNQIFYLHPSFGYFFESFYPDYKGLANRLSLYPPDIINPPSLTQVELDQNQKLFNGLEQTFSQLSAPDRRSSASDEFLASYYSRALNTWGVALQRNHQAKEAGKWFKIAADLNTNNVPAKINLRYNQQLLSGDKASVSDGKDLESKFFESYRNWDQILADNGPFDHPDFCYRLGSIFASRGLLRQAAIEFSRVQILQPTNIIARIAMVNLYLQGSRPDNALKEIKRIRESSPPGGIPAAADIELIRREASALFSQTNTPAAEQLLLKAQADHPRDLGILDTLVQMYNSTGRYKDSLGTVAKMLAISPGNADILITRATIQFMAQTYDQAIDSLEEVLRKTPGHVQALVYKTFLLIQKKDFTRAQTVVENVLKIDPKNLEALIYASVIQMENKKYERAVDFLDTVLKEDPANWNALRNRALAHLRGGSLSKAKTDYESLLRKEPRYHVPYFGLGEIAYQRKDMEAAIRNYELYLQYAPAADLAELKEERQLVTGRLQELKAGRR